VLKTPQERFLDEFGLLLNDMGTPKMMARIFAWLMICDPPHQSSQQLMDRLSTTSATVSTNTRLLIGAGLVKKVHVEGSRATFFRLEDDSFEHSWRVHLAQMAKIRELVDRAVEELAPHTPTDRLTELTGFYDFAQARLEQLFVDWEAHASSGSAGSSGS
jgi:DNA-binding transcriptional regulator GbsR (MarR family)